MSGEHRLVVVGLEASLCALDAVRDGLGRAGRDMALIGGIAVLARAGQPHRATTDADTAVDAPAEGRPSPELLVAQGIAAPTEASHRVVAGGVEVDCIDTMPLDSLAGLTEQQALFVGGHRLAFETATPTALTSGTVTVRLRVATRAGLLATKLHAARFRKDPDRRGADRSDLAVLLVDGPESVADELLAADVPWLASLVDLVADGIDDLMRARSAETSALVSPSGVELGATDLEVMADRFLERLRA